MLLAVLFIVTVVVYHIVRYIICKKFLAVLCVTGFITCRKARSGSIQWKLQQLSPQVASDELLQTVDVHAKSINYTQTVFGLEEL